MCTSFTIGSADSGFVYGRTMEFTLDLKSQVMVVPKGTSMTATGKDGEVGKGGLTWESSHGWVGTNALGLDVTMDGMNDAGLVFGLLNFPASAKFMEVPDADQASALSCLDVGAFLLSTCATVDEVRAALERVPVQGVAFGAYAGQVPGVHYCVHDESGRALVIEYTGSGPEIHENPTTVMTNEPRFRSQLDHLGLYQTVTNNAPEPVHAGDLVLQANSSGDGTAGLPAGFTAAARFVRAFWYARFAVAFDDGEQGVRIARHILNQFDIPPGTVMTEAGGTGEGGGVAGPEITQWQSVADIKNRVYYVSSYDHPNLAKIDIAKATAAANGIAHIALPGSDAIPELLPA